MAASTACGVRGWPPDEGLSARQLALLQLLFAQYPQGFPGRYRQFAECISKLTPCAVTEWDVERAVVSSDVGAFASGVQLPLCGLLGPVAFPSDCTGRRLQRCLRCQSELAWCDEPHNAQFVLADSEVCKGTWYALRCGACEDGNQVMYTLAAIVTKTGLGRAAQHRMYPAGACNPGAFAIGRSVQP